jgi:putative transposase
MPRQLRIDLPGLPQHVVTRGIDRQQCFFTDTDRAVYLHCLLVAARERECAIHAYVLMTNHVHLLVTGAREGAVGKMMQSIGRRYVRSLNNVLGRTGTLFEGRYRSSPVESRRYFLACMRYIESNPVRANLVDDPARYPWSSHRFNLGLDASSLLSPHAEYLQLGFDAAARAKAYRSLFEHDPPAAELAAILEHANRGRALGRPEFQASLESRLQRCVRLRPPGRPFKNPDNVL